MQFLQPINWWFGFRNHPPYATWRPSADAPRRACGLGNRSLAQLDMWKIHENSPPKKISRIILKLMWVKQWWITHLYTHLGMVLYHLSYMIYDLWWFGSGKITLKIPSNSICPDLQHAFSIPARGAIHQRHRAGRHTKAIHHGPAVHRFLDLPSDIVLDYLPGVRHG